MKAHVYRHVLAAIDLAYGSQQVVDAAAGIARAAGARLTLLHVLDYSTATGSDFPILTPLQERSALVTSAQRRLKEMAAAAGCTQAEIRVIVGHPQSEIPEAATVLSADLVIVGSWRTRLAAWLRTALRRALGRRGWDVLRV
jgi:universal stress protein A